MNIREIRKKEKLSRQDFADKIGISVHTLDSWETGRRNVPESKIKLIETLFSTMYKENKDNVISTIKSNSKFAEQRYKKEVIIIPAKAGLSLMSNYYAEELLQEMEKRTIYLDKDAKGRYFEIEGEGDSMNDGTKDAILDGDKLLIREVSKLYWNSPFHKNDWDFTFFHLEHGFLTKCILEQNTETGDILLGSRNPDKEQYPDFWINLKDCAFVCNVVEVRRQKGIYYTL